mmetsp:Transcript_22397/g.59506  ORF Transcript_22397/g.59506 Transcript_22397/m.59506 type:complete len:137 (-) Transcript_22397:425-835(-)
MKGELLLYINANKTHYIIVHRPLCVAGDSRETTPMWKRLRRALSAAVAANIGRKFRNLPFLSKSTVGRDPIAAITIGEQPAQDFGAIDTRRQNHARQAETRAGRGASSQRAHQRPGALPREWRRGPPGSVSRAQGL